MHAGKAYVVLGASGDIGKSLSQKLRYDGARLFLIGRDRKKLEQIASQTKANFAIWDACDYSQLENHFESANELLGKIDGLVNCIGNVILKPAHLTTFDELQSMISANFYSSFACVKFSVKYLKNNSSIVLISSAAARVGLPNHEAVASSKAAVEGLVRSAAASYARRGIRVNCVAPGLVETSLTQSLTNGATLRQSSIAMHPIGRLGTPEDIAEACSWLLSDSSSWVTGQCLGVDGGIATLRGLPSRP